ncbi:MAG: hypothetical protein COV45_05795 [Deltaproteobacteria bacterium CG11_big_fil_rev_8_21_14_0_20_47_16]|nr:MAG: hypothetical protein COV45_05795 [Deltaproteobacteria bacterium CG11_big_fil_rev_8_21_14_0_20_47_16]
MSVTRYLALRYLFPHRGWRISYFTTTAILAVAIAVMVQVLVLSVMRGFRADLIEKFVGLNPHIRLVSTEAPLQLANMTWIPAVEGQGILDAGSGVETGVHIRGVTPALLAQMPTLEWALPVDKDPVTAFEMSGVPIAIGVELASQFGATPNSARTVNMIAPFGQVTPSGDLAPNRITATVRAVFRSGLYEADQSLVLMPAVYAKQLLGPQATEAWWGYTDTPMQVSRIAQQLRNDQPDATITTWQEENAALFGALTLERRVMTALLALVVAIAATGIIAVLFLLVSSRQQEMGILLALGCSPTQIRQVFMWHGAMVGAMGGVLGIGVALLGCTVISHMGIPLPDSLYVRVLPVSISIPGLVAIAVGSCLVTTFAAFWPARGIGEHSIMEQLKYE